jgi:hypothetical protein
VQLAHKVNQERLEPLARLDLKETKVFRVQLEPQAHRVSRVKLVLQERRANKVSKEFKVKLGLLEQLDPKAILELLVQQDLKANKASKESKVRLV